MIGEVENPIQRRFPRRSPLHFGDFASLSIKAQPIRKQPKRELFTAQGIRFRGLMRELVDWREPSIRDALAASRRFPAGTWNGLIASA